MPTRRWRNIVYHQERSMATADAKPALAYGVMGWGRTGESVAAFLAARSIPFCVWDDDVTKQQKARDAGYAVGVPPWEHFKGRLVVSPGVPWDNALLVAARQAGVPVISDIQLFLEIFRPLHTIGVTGSNGKTTTCALLQHGLQAMGYKAIVAGNVGHPIFNTVDAQGCIPSDTVFVLELSSYQLEYSQALNLTSALILNIVPHHLERHGSMERYASIKHRILSHAQRGWMPSAWPCHPSTNPAEDKAKATKEAASTRSLRTWQEMSFSHQDLSPFLQTPHNRLNIAAAMHVLSDFGTLPAGVWLTFQGLEHRQEWVAAWKGVHFVNDSKATNPHAAAAALEQWSMRGAPLVWIAGGVCQQDRLDVINPYVSAISGAFFLGEAAHRYAQWFAQQHGGHHAIVSSMEEAVKHAFQWAQRLQTEETSAKGNDNHWQGVCVLLSPGCASQDMFDHFEHRGWVFKDVVRALMHREGASDSGPLLETAP